MQPQQRFCTNCGQQLTPGSAFCVSCGSPIGTSSPSPGSVPPFAQAPTQSQDDPLLAGLAAGFLARRIRRRPRRARRPGSRLRGCGCVLLLLAALAAPFIGVALTSGRLQLIFICVAGGMVLVFCLLWLIGMLATRRGREALAEGCAEGCLDAILSGFLGGG